MTKEKKITQHDVIFNNVYEVLSYAQKHLHAPKTQFNKFGNYYFRNVEDIQEGLKKVLPVGAACFVTDTIEFIGDRFYVKATATLCYGSECVHNTAYAREPIAQKGMSDPQLTGSTSSYARKYALGGLFLVDDTKDADSQDNATDQKQNKTNSQNNNPPIEKTVDPKAEAGKKMLSQIREAQTLDALVFIYNSLKGGEKILGFSLSDLSEQGQQAILKTYNEKTAALLNAEMEI